MVTKAKPPKSTPKPPKPAGAAAVLTKSKKQLLEKQLRENTVALFNIIFTIIESDGETFEDFAKRAGLSSATVYRMWGGTWVYPRHQTVQKMAYAAGVPQWADNL